MNFILSKEFGNGPYTPEQQKQKDALLAYLNKENTQFNNPSTLQQPQSAASNSSQATASNSTNNAQLNEANASNSSGQQANSQTQNQVLLLGFFFFLL